VMRVCEDATVCALVLEVLGVDSDVTCVMLRTALDNFDPDLLVQVSLNVVRIKKTLQL